MKNKWISKNKKGLDMSKSINNQNPGKNKRRKNVPKKPGNKLTKLQ